MTAMVRSLMLCCWCLLFTFQVCFSSAFVVGTSRPFRQAFQQLSMAVADGTSTSSSSSTTRELLLEPLYSSLLAEGSPTASLLNFTLEQHRPLGCTIEESLARVETTVDDLDLNQPSRKAQDTRLPYVFVSKVQPKSFAQAAGLQVGDVIVGSSGLFGTVEDVTHAGIDKIRGLIGSCPDDDPLQLQIVRGSSVLQAHERALVDLCTQVGTDDEEVESCLLDYLKGGYDDSPMELDEDEKESLLLATNGADNNICDDDKETECLLDSMYGMWAEDLPDESSKNGVGMTDESGTKEPEQRPVIKPWSSRSSPSGTFVRDPATGRMTNIDAEW